MKRLLSAYFKLSRSERLGMSAILVLTILLFAGSLCMRWLVPAVPDMDEQRLNLAWQQAQAVPPVLTGGETGLRPFAFDPNTLDSAGFIRLGLSARTTAYLMNWRRKGKRFYRKEDLKPLYTLNAADYERLAPYIFISGQQQGQQWPERYTALPPLPDAMDLNTIDSASLLRLDGIGTMLAHKIIQRRSALGSFLNTDQLLEVYRFPDSAFSYLRTKLAVYPRTVKKIGLNTATEAQLSAHPYIGPIMAKNILLLRSGLNKYEKTEQLRQVPLMNEEKYRKIAPYCTID